MFPLDHALADEFDFFGVQRLLMLLFVFNGFIKFPLMVRVMMVVGVMRIAVALLVLVTMILLLLIWTLLLSIWTRTKRDPVKIRSAMLSSIYLVLTRIANQLHPTVLAKRLAYWVSH